VRVGFPSLTDFALLTNTDAWIGTSEITHGKFHSNGGVRFDGVGDAQITSAVPTYTCKSFQGCNNVTKPGVWGVGGPTNLWNFPVPAQDFSAVTAKLSEIKVGAQAAGIYLSASGKQGWRLQFVGDGTVKAYKVNSTNCYNGLDINATQYVFYCIDVKTLGTATTYTLPANGFIYVDDTVWVDGVVKGRAISNSKGEILDLRTFDGSAYYNQHFKSYFVDYFSGAMKLLSKDVKGFDPRETMSYKQGSIRVWDAPNYSFYKSVADHDKRLKEFSQEVADLKALDLEKRHKTLDAAIRKSDLEAAKVKTKTLLIL
jgi:hypothetical protein